MNKKRVALVLLIGILVFGYVKLFYKKIDYTSIPNNADCIIALDVKKITNTIIWNIITTPSQWKISSSKQKSTDEVNWKDAIELPDYALAFHIKEQPINIWYIQLEIKNENKFSKYLAQNNFIGQGFNIYLNPANSISLIKAGDKFIVTNNTSTYKQNLATIANDLFVQKNYTPKPTFKKITNTKSHVAMYFTANNFLEQDGIITANFDKEKLKINGKLLPKKEFDFKEKEFAYSANSLLTFGFTQPTHTVYGLLSDTIKNNISKIINQNVNTLLAQNNKHYQIDFAGILPRADSAISYTYDDDFNKVEKAVVNIIQEPAFQFSIEGDSVSNIFNYWVLNKKIEKTSSGNLFVPFPFVKTYCEAKNDNLLTITSKNYTKSSANKTTNGILFLHLLFAKIPTNLLKYLPNNAKKVIQNLEFLDIVAKKEKEEIKIECLLLKKNNNTPFIDL